MKKRRYLMFAGMAFVVGIAAIATSYLAPANADALGTSLVLVKSVLTFGGFMIALASGLTIAAVIV